MRSIALDPSIYPEGGLFFLEFEKPDFSGFVLNQDRGSAIKGYNRVDLYCGEGKKAGELAGKLKNKGKLYLLLLD
jgi:membrane-bound lytic murein transglycosylase A